MSTDLRLAGAAVGCWLSALACLYCTAMTAWLLALAAALLTGALLTCTSWRRGPRPLLRPAARGAFGMVLAAVAIGVVCGAAATAARVSQRDAEPLAGLVRVHGSVVARLAVSDDPRAVHGAVGRAPTFVVAARLRWVQDEDGARTAIGARVLVLAGDPAWRGLLPGQEVTVSGRLSASRGGDLRAAVLSVNSAPREVTGASEVQRAAGALRAGLQRACSTLPTDAGGLLPGLVVGDTSRLDPGLADDFRATGLTHLVAVSGANVAILTGLVLLLARWCRIGPRTSAVLCALTLVGFVILARPSPSVLRAAAMGGLAVVALAIGRPRAAVPALAAGVVVLVVIDPELAADAGFALSVLATAGLMLLAPQWAAALRRHRVPAGVAEALAVPAAAHVACAPVIAALSGTVSMTTVPANLLAGPVVAPATVLGVVAAVVSPVWSDGAAFLAWLASWPARWLVAVARHGARVPDGVLPWPDGAVGGLLLAVLTVAVLVAARRPIVRRVALVVALAAVLGAVPVRIVAGGWPPTGWIVVACDVGQGDSLVLAAGPGSAVVVDAGPDPESVDGCLERLGVSTIGILVLSHFHVDHVGGLDGVLRGRSVGRALVSPSREPGASRAAALGALAAKRAPVEPVAGDTSYTLRGVNLQVLGPVEELSGTRSDPNNNSLVVRVTVAGHVVLLTGDAEDEEQRELLAALGPAALRAEVLKVPHHGSAYQDPDFLSAVGARVGLVSVGAGNDYGHPSAALLARLGRDGQRVLRTDQEGDVAVVADGPALSVVSRGRP
jgi:competence protein ComEC